MHTQTYLQSLTSFCPCYFLDIYFNTPQHPSYLLRSTSSDTKPQEMYCAQWKLEKNYSVKLFIIAPWKGSHPLQFLTAIVLWESIMKNEVSSIQMPNNEIWLHFALILLRKAWIHFSMCPVSSMLSWLTDNG